MAMREIIFDTETTGLEFKNDRIIEIGGVEMVDRFVTGRTFHVYINPQGREVHPEALAVHGISNADLEDKPKFDAIVDDFLKFFDGAKLVAHNAKFDISFINAELARINLPPIENDRVIDTLAIARRKHPMGPNSLDALCKRYGIDNARRTKHGALLDSEILAEVYIELSGGKQAALQLAPEVNNDKNSKNYVKPVEILPRETPLAPKLTLEELEAHRKMVEKLGPESLWAKMDLK